MLFDSAQKKPSIQCRISIEFIDPAHQLNTNILGSEILLLYMVLFQRHSGTNATHVGC